MKTYIFDFDGVLVDSMPVWAGTYVKLLDANNISYPEDIVKIITPLGNEGAAKYLISLGVEMSVEEILEHSMAVYKFEYANNILPKNNVAKVLRELKNRGDSLNVLTASSHEYVDPCLKNAGVFELFDNVWSSDEFFHTKAETVIYEMAAEKLGNKLEECFFLDDNYIALSTAKKAGMKAIGVYDSASDDFVEDMKKMADKYIYDFEELL